MIFIDCGAHDGLISREFLNGDFGKIGESPEIYAFEPNKTMCPKWDKMRKDFPGVKIQLHQKAVWVENTTCNYVDFEGHNTANNIMNNLKIDAYKSTRCYEIEAIDFDFWMRENFSATSKNSDIVLKMNLEGAEFTVVPKMIFGGSIFLVNKMILHWHDRFDSKKLSPIRSNLEEWFKNHPELNISFVG